ncbi:hypothetical protein LPTSP3_g30840 [Leptospira kobayashii]|uniref:RNA-directed DNA polymerase n=1 Tax=Leptospira kobayashii TaxID=1917830 RepID=A0ABM7UM82_9LEPT|nr:reverse transcriptase domain-containing protein [Leptospira kobayashii]BDA80154.1 hypothetical protein LPTSP3_g30840 [Leptospira kobayashii]
MAKVRTLIWAFLYHMLTLDEFEEKIGISIGKLNYIGYILKEEDKYLNFEISKRNGNSRQINSPNSILKHIQNRIKLILEENFHPYSVVHGFVNDKSILSNAKKHLNAKWILNLDIENFFGTINFGRVLGLFLSKPYKFDKKIATLIAQLVTYQNVLPQGSPASPIISNLICNKMDRDFISFCKSKHLIYTRYADDITISSQKRKYMNFDSTLDEDLLEDIKKLVNENGFKINSDKVSFSYGKDGGIVTGLRVNEKINIPRKTIRSLRGLYHSIRSNGYQVANEIYNRKYKNLNRLPKENKELINHINGHLNFIFMIKGQFDDVYSNYYNKFKTQLKLNIKSPIPKSVWDYIFIMESESTQKQGTAFKLNKFGIISCEHVYDNYSKIFLKNNFSKKFDLELIKKDERIDLIKSRALDLFIEDGLEINLDFHYKIGSKLRLLGFPNYRIGDSGMDKLITIVSKRTVSGVERILVDSGIVAGNSGGPILDLNGAVVGIAVTGAEDHDKLDVTENHSFIPIKYLLQF